MSDPSSTYLMVLVVLKSLMMCVREQSVGSFASVFVFSRMFILVSGCMHLFKVLEVNGDPSSCLMILFVPLLLVYGQANLRGKRTIESSCKSVSIVGLWTFGVVPGFFPN